MKTLKKIRIKNKIKKTANFEKKKHEYLENKEFEKNEFRK